LRLKFGATWMMMEAVSAYYAITLLVGFGILAAAQAPDSPLFRFEDYPVTRIFKGTPVSPILTKPEERRYRTVILRIPR
jgi:hypothetical protein